MLFARLEEMEHGDEGRAREWMTRAVRARRDPAWTADGFVSDRWLPVSPVTGRLDAFVWMEPLGQIGGTGAGIGDVIEAGEETAAIAAPAAPVAPPVRGAPEVAMAGAADGQSAPAPEPPRPEAPAVPAAAARNAAAAAPAAKSEKVIPLLHAPDDPGPDGEPQTDAIPEPPPPASNGWDRLRALFK
jgi:HemY protein